MIAIPSRAREAMRDSPAALFAFVAGLVMLTAVILQQILSVPLTISVLEGHHWRQAFTYGVAWNFAHGPLDVVHPRMFVELARSGSNVIPMEAPLYPLLASFLMRAMRDSVVAPRLLSLSGLALTLFALTSWLDVQTRPRRDPGGVLADRAGLLLALALSPSLAVDYRSIQPEPLAAGLVFVAVLAFDRYASSGARRDLVVGAALYALSLLAKPLALGVAPALLLLGVWRVDEALWSRPTLRRTLTVGGALTLAIAPWFAWDRWAQHMLARDLGGEWVIEIGHPPLAMWQSLMGGAHSHDGLINLLPNYATSWWLPPAIAAGVWRGLADRRTNRFTFVLLLFLSGYFVELLSLGARLPSNAYYLILAVGPLAYFAALGLGALFRLLDTSSTSMPGVMIRPALLCLVILPVGSAFSRPSSWSVATDVASLGFDRNHLVWTSDLGLGRLLLLVLVVLALAPQLCPRRVPRWLGLPVTVGFLALMIRPAGDTNQYFRFYVASQRRAGFEAEIAELRAAVARYSTPQDRVLLSPAGTYREPGMVYFQYALRDGFPYAGATPAELDQLRARGARLYLQIDQLQVKNQTTLPTHAPAVGRLLREGPWWRLSCAAADGCPEPR